jgi:hypothetical protein
MEDPYNSTYIISTLIGVIVSLSAVIIFLYKEGKKAIDDKFEIARAGLILGEKLADVKDQSKDITAALLRLEIAINNNKCNVSSVQKE